MVKTDPIEPLPTPDYIRIISKLSGQYDMLKENPTLVNNWVGRETSGLIKSLDPRINSNGPNVSLVDSVKDILNH